MSVTTYIEELKEEIKALEADYPSLPTEHDYSGMSWEEKQARDYIFDLKEEIRMWIDELNTKVE